MVIGDITMMLICNDKSGKEIGRIIARRGVTMVCDESEVYDAIYGLRAGEDINWDAVSLDERFDNITYMDLYDYAREFFNTDFDFADCMCA